MNDSAATHSTKARPARDIQLNLSERYKVIRAQEGGMGLVLFCYDHEDQNRVVLKSIRSDVIDRHHRRVQFLQEATDWIYLGRHPNIVEAYRAEQTHNPFRVYLVMEWVGAENEHSGASLSEIFARRRRRPFTFRRSLEIALDIACGMNHAVNRIAGLVHRDLKPGNILIGNNSVAKITDFGLARSFLGENKVGEEQQLVESSVPIKFHAPGTPAYAAPEQWNPAMTVDVRADIYSLGLILYELITGVRAVQGKDAQDYYYIHSRGLLPAIPDQVPVKLANLIASCTALDRADRYPDWLTVENVLRKTYEHITGEAAPLRFNDHSTPNDDSIRNAESYLAIGDSYQNLGHPEIAEQYFNEVIKTGTRSELPALILKGQHALGLTFDSQDKSYESIEVLHQGLKTARELDEPILIIDSLMLLGSVLARGEDKKTALEMLNEAMALAKEIDDFGIETTVLGNLANCFAQNHQLDKAISLYYDLLGRSNYENDIPSKAKCLSNLGVALVATGQQEKSTEIFVEALALYDRVEDIMGKVFSLKQLCSAYDELGNQCKVAQYGDQYLLLVTQMNNPVEIQWINELMGNTKKLP